MDIQALWLTLRLALSTTALPAARRASARAGGSPRRAALCDHGAGRGGPAAGASPDRPRLLSPGGAGPADRAGAPHHAPARTSAGLQLHRTARRLGPVQPAVRRAAAGRRLSPSIAPTSKPPPRLGVSPLRRLPRHRRCRSRSSLLTAAVLTFTHTVGEFGVVLMLGGNIPEPRARSPSRSTTRCRTSITQQPTAPPASCSHSACWR